MSKSDALEAGILDLIFKNLALTGVGDAGGLLPSATAGSLYVSLHTADPAEGGNQTSNEIGYTSYARVAVTRGAGWTRTGNSISPTAAITFPAGTGGSGTATHFGIGTDSAGAGKLLYSGTINPNIVCGNGVTPQLTTATAITED